MKVLVSSRQTKRSYVDAFWDGEIRELQGKKQEALDYYIESQYLFKKYIQSQNPNSDQQKHKDQIDSKIRSLGGSAD
ncbi:MAG: hypothetical protein ACOVNZ_05930 [Crocinitomicaceae bacterium]